MKINFLDEFHIEDIQSPTHPSDFSAHDDYTLLILRLPEVLDGEVLIHSYAFVTKEDETYLYDREEKHLVKLGSLFVMSEFLDEKMERLIKVLMQYHYEIELLEDELYDKEYPDDFMEKWLTYKKNLSLFHRLLFFAILSFELFQNYHKRHHSYKELAYDDLLEHMVRIRDLSQSGLEKLENFYNFYRAKVDERMNRNIYYLTILSGIFLPLTLLTGFFGMNTGGLPFTTDEGGTWKVVLLAMGLEVLFFVPFLWQRFKK